MSLNNRLMQAILTNKSEQAFQIIQQGADVRYVSEGGNTPLIYAALRGNKLLIDLLIDRGADVNCSNEYGHSALVCAAQKGYKNVVKSLLQKGADPNQRTISKGEEGLPNGISASDYIHALDDDELNTLMEVYQVI